MGDRHVGQDSVAQVEDPRTLTPGLQQLIDAPIQHRPTSPEEQRIKRALDRLYRLDSLTDCQRTGRIQRHSLDIDLRRILFRQRGRAPGEADQRHSDAESPMATALS